MHAFLVVLAVIVVLYLLAVVAAYFSGGPSIFGGPFLAPVLALFAALLWVVDHVADATDRLSQWGGEKKRRWQIVTKMRRLGDGGTVTSIMGVTTFKRGNCTVVEIGGTLVALEQPHAIQLAAAIADQWGACIVTGETHQTLSEKIDDALMGRRK